MGALGAFLGVVLSAGMALAQGQQGSSHRFGLLQESYVSTRAQGMAGTGLGLVRGGEAGFLNPALIGGLPGEASGGLRHASFPGLSVGATEAGTELMGRVVGDESSQGAAQSGFGGVVGAMGPSEGASYRQQLFPHVVYGPLLFGLLQSSVLDFQTYRDGENREFTEVFLRGQLAGVLGFAVPMGQRATLGVAGRYGLRTTALGELERRTSGEKEALDALTDDLPVTQGYAVDAGVYVSLGELFKLGRGDRLGLSVVGRNLGEGQYEPMDSKSEGGAPKPLKDETLRDPSDVDVGLSWSPEARRGDLAYGLSLEAREVVRPDIGLDQKLRLGAELALGRALDSAPVSFRLGHDFRNPSFGLSVDALLFRLEGAYYSSVVRLPAGVVREEATYLLRSSWDLVSP